MTRTEVHDCVHLFFPNALLLRNSQRVPLDFFERNTKARELTLVYATR